MIQDCRGRWDSDGDFYPFREAEDGFDTQEWVGLQPWCNGKLGTAGASYLGIVQWTAAPRRSSHLACMSPRVMGPDFHGSIAYPGGAFQLGVMLTWGMRTNARTAQSIDYHIWTEAFHTLPIIALDEAAGRDVAFLEGLGAPPDVRRLLAQPRRPRAVCGNRRAGLHHGRLVRRVRERHLPQLHRHAAPRAHRRGAAQPVDRRSVGARPERIHPRRRRRLRAAVPVRPRCRGAALAGLLAQGNHHGIADEPPLKLFIMGAGEWRDEWEWPLTRTEWRSAYLGSGGGANTLRGDGRLAFAAPQGEGADYFDYDPRYPVQTVGGNNCCSPEIVPWGPYDQRGVEMRPDVLCYTSERLVEDLEVTGPLELVLYAATDGLDTDWTAKLVDVSPTGYARNLCDGIIRARYRQGMAGTALLEPGAVYEYRIEVGVTGNLFRAGHRIRLEGPPPTSRASTATPTPATSSAWIGNSAPLARPCTTARATRRTCACR